MDMLLKLVNVFKLGNLLRRFPIRKLDKISVETTPNAFDSPVHPDGRVHGHLMQLFTINLFYKAFSEFASRSSDTVSFWQ